MSLLMDQPLPVLMMEQVMSSLHAYLLYPDNSNLPVGSKVAIYKTLHTAKMYVVISVAISSVIPS